MCGILGFNWKNEELANKLADSIKHRGPDQGGFYFDEKISLGHRRLAILDLSEKGKQPMTTSDGNFIIVFNGEIYNYKEIKDSLLKKGYKFKSTSDTEVLLYGYKEWGKDILGRLNGQFAFAVYNKEKQEIFLARDRTGINPLYYYFKDGKFIFGSELKVILESGIKKDIDKFSLNYYLMYGYTPRERSIIKGAFKLLPASYLVFSLKENKIVERNKYWDFELENKIKDEDEAKKLILKQLEKSVKARMMGDVPIGAFLSGGVDSSAVVAMMSKFTDSLNTFSVKFDYADFDESKYARIISDKFKTNHHEIEFSARDVKELIPELIHRYDEPFADPSMIPMFLVSKIAREKVVVALSGDGADELFGGYSSYLVYKIINLQRYCPKFLFKLGYFIVKKLNSPKLLKLKKFLGIGLLDNSLKYGEFRSFLYRDEFKMVSDDNPEDYYREYVGAFGVDGDYLQQATNIDIRNYMTDNCLVKVDRASLGNSLESRPPMLDSNMVKLAVKISSDLKIKGKETKYVLKKALEGVLPNEVLYRAKKGFGVPLKYYLKGELRQLVDKYVIDYRKHNFYKDDIIKEIKRVMNQEEWTKDYSRIIAIFLWTF